MDMGDLAGAIAPRPLVIVAGRIDELFPFAGVEAAFADIQGIYRAAAKSVGNPAIQQRCQLVVGEGGHRFYATQAWEAFRQVSGW